jgi:hypothetical protein
MSVTDNMQLPISKVRGFLGLAENRGCYSRSQRGNLETAWTIFLKNLSPELGPPESISIETITVFVDGVFRRYGSENKVSPTTVRAYQTRVKHLLDDFVAHNGGDFMAWKESLSRNANALGIKARKRRKSPADGPETSVPAPVATSATVLHRLVLSEGREGTLVLPTQLTEDDIDPVWEQLDALRTLIRAQIGALKKKQRTS